ncbi:putative bifunctional diguanylate cyclase/phosphodiesterase [Aliagarivorans taiwanensis]|uniref:putative bifunctional diguanylate cyclase/phosphodiesterase n=1 Tax=Aliagarivorans taiwanensis TaxID=561966 RepID=UPI0003F6977F|nr:GGDEF domain-containing phosphodiesterase [Aliagarivorans taiwanensis]
MQPLRLGLANKALLVLFSVLLIAQIGMISFNRDNLSELFQVHRQQQHQSNAVRLEAYYRELSERLQSLTAAQQVMFEGSNRSAKQAMADYWNSLLTHSNLPVSGMLTLDHSAGQALQYGDFEQSEGAGRWMHAVTYQPEQVNWLVDCQSYCSMLYVAKLERPNAAPLKVFYRVDLAKMLRYQPAIDAAYYLIVSEDDAGKPRLLYSNVPNEDQSFLVELLQRYQLNEIVDGSPVVDTPIGPSEVNSLAITSTSYEQPLYYLLLNDVSSELAQFDQADRNNLLFGAMLLAGSLLIVAVILHPPLTRIRRTIISLPLLGRSSHSLFRNNLQRHGKRWMSDESGQLDSALIRLSYQLETLEQQLKSRAEELDWVANFDSLTALPNRRKFERELTQRLQDECSGSLLLIDLDNFKLVNDISGHSAGDELLRRVAVTLKRMLPDDVLMARISGDEFAVFLEDTDENSARTVAQRIISLFDQVHVPGHNIIHSAAACVGIVASPEHGVSYEELMGKADISVNQAKENGKNCVVSFQVRHESKALAQRHYWLDLAQHCIERDALELHFQPIMNNLSNRVEHYEVLLRVRDEDGALHSPYQLILAAEKSGRVEHIDLWVVQRALQQMQDNLQMGCHDKLAINLSARSFCSERVISRIAREFDSRNIPGEMIIFEITETAALPNLQQAEEHIRRLKELGCAIALDDFGVGYSSFHSLKQLPLDYIKIDGSFVREAGLHHANKVFIQALVNIASQLGHKTVAEFVESGELNQQLIELGVDYSQGYYIGKPARAETFWQYERAAEVLSS